MADANRQGGGRNFIPALAFACLAAAVPCGSAWGAPQSADVGYLDALNASGRVLLVATGDDANLDLSARNLPGVSIIRPDSLNIVDVMNADVLLITQPSLQTMAEVYA